MTYAETGGRSRVSTQPLVYVMTPVYNGEDYLRQCIESVLTQTYSNWVYTIVNNRSTDRTLEIAQEYAASDSRIRIHNNRDFLPIIENHNLAYRLIPAESKYCKPLMADDWLYPQCLTEMVRLAEANPSIGLVCTCGYDGTTIWGRPPIPGAFMSGRDICRATFFEGSRQFFGSPTQQLIRADLIRKREPFEDPSNTHADVGACFDILQESDFGFVYEPVTGTRIHKNSMSSRVARFESALLAHLAITAKFAPVYLTEKEQKEVLDGLFSEYYQAIAKRTLRLPGQEFWNFQRTKLQSLGYSLDKRRLIRATLHELWLCLQRPITSRVWERRVNHTTQTITAIVPEGNSFIFVDDDQWHAEALMSGRRRIPFLEKYGEYWGSPEDDATAIRELERLRQTGASYIVFAWPAFWWLDHYTGLRRYLDSQFRCVFKNSDVVIFDLRHHDPATTLSN